MPNVWSVPKGLKLSNKITFNIEESIHETIQKHNLDIVNLNSCDINSQDVIDKIKNSKGRFIIFGGSGGQILKLPVLSAGKPILHAHPGLYLKPEGSTTVYYSILSSKKSYVSAFFFNEKIDEGHLVLQEEFD